MPARTNRYGGRRKCFAVGAIGLGLLPFIIVECVLRLSGLGAASSYEDPFVGFAPGRDLFVRVESDAGSDAAVWRTAPEKLSSAPRRPRRNVRRSQTLQVESVNALGR